MIEFVMSRVWLVIAGLAMAAAVLVAFTGLDDGTRDRAAVDGANALADLIGDLRTNGQTGEVRIDGRDVIFANGYSLRVCNGSIWVQNGQTERAVVGPGDLVLVEGSHIVDTMTIRPLDQLVVRSFLSGGKMGVQLEKVDATSLTASTNSLHSSSVL
jgi:hypothetical protein